MSRTGIAKCRYSSNPNANVIPNLLQLGAMIRHHAMDMHGG